MKIAVLIEPIAENGYQAKGGDPFGLQAEGATRAEALQRLRELIQERMQAGAEIVTLELPAGDNPWTAFAGMFQDNPLFDRWQQCIDDSRREADETAETQLARE